MTKMENFESFIHFTFNSKWFKPNIQKRILIIVFYSWFCGTVVTQVKSDVVLFIDLVNFSNPSGALYNGQCCDSYLNQKNCSALPPRCDVAIKICIDSSDFNLNASDWNSCNYGSYVLNGLRNLNTFEFSQNPQSTRPFIFILDWNSKTLPRYLIKFFAIDDNSDRRAININEKDKLIDFYLVDFNKNQNIIPTNGLSDTIDWISYLNQVGQLSNNNFKTYLSFRVSIKCRTNFFTPLCNVRCVKQDSCEGGHYDCDENTGAKICHKGFYDPDTNCVKRDFSIQLCEKTDQEYCSGKGFCYRSLFLSSNETIATCCCNKGFGGYNCSEIVSCEITTCQNGGECFIEPQIGYGICRCKLGFTGKYCENKIVCPDNYYGDNCDTRCEAIDTCEIHQECDYFGRLKCKDGWGSFPNCNTRLINPSIDPECPVISENQDNFSPCLNGGSCWKGGCCCSPGYTGPRCESVVDQCLSSPCLNGGTCKSTFNGFSCICLPSFSGIFCQAYIDPCRDSTAQCSNHGVCVPFQNYTDFSCSCYQGYTGKYCESQIDYCESMPCVNNATCVSVFKGYFCNCQPNFSGINCGQNLDMCSSRPCIHGICNNLINDYFCNCDAGWTNPKTCNDDIDECQITPSICLNNSTCINELGSFKCVCSSGFTGRYCENQVDFCSSNSCIQSQTNFCLNNHTYNTFNCICKPGFSGQLCESQIDYCASNPCIRDQFERCINYQLSYSCICKLGFSGCNCEIDDNECLSNPCSNNGICIDQINSFKCICPPGYTGQTCLINTNPCILNQTTNFNICGPFGTCYPQYYPNNTLSYYCQCIQGYEGQNCDKTKSICTMYSPCLNSGTCVDVPPDNFTCICQKTHTGAFCENLVDPCLKGVNLCNAGTCVNSPIGSSNFTCLCPSQYTGQFCDIFIDPCENNKCTPGHSICQSAILSNHTHSYNCFCYSGYTGQYCEQTIDYCTQKPCQNNATCNNMFGYHTCQCLPNYFGNNCEYFNACSLKPCNPIGTIQCIDLSPSSFGINYKCSCIPGYTGQNCEVNINECLSSPCKNNGTCTDLVNSFICQCTDNYQGVLCETQFDFCKLNQCAHGSTCVPTENSYKCLCPLDKTGFLCDLLVDRCESLPCQNGGSCVNLITDFTCNCAPSYTGKNCSEIIDQCAISLCQNNATCVNLVNSYLCNCPASFTGTLCDKPIDFCSSSPGQILCLNGGTCYNEADRFRCECTNDYTGSRCDSKIDLCNTAVCQNNGICRTRPDGSGVYCTCPSGFTGYFCEVPINNCELMPCLNNATCINLLNNFACYCPFNYFGTRCENKLNFCQSSPCRNGGTCIDQNEGFKCRCPVGYTGEICQIKLLACASFPCLYGLCNNLPNGNFKCICEHGFTGTLCSERIDVCKTGIEGSPACFNNGSCFNSFNPNTSSLFFCVCPPEFTGLRCETKKNACESFPCIRGNCTEIPDGHYMCLCPTGYTGLNCETDINECNSQVCFNNATCINTPGSFECRCLDGYSGRYCELTIDNCHSNPCQNGLCLNENGSFKCICLFGFTGTLCEQAIDFCQSLPCQNQATCLSSEKNSFKCLCQNGYTGLLCEQLVDPCESHPCKNNAFCINRSTYLNPNNFSCVCQPGFTGKFCDNRVDPCLNNTRCLNGGTCFDIGLNQFKCVCQIGYTGANCEIMDNCLSFPCLNGGTCFNSYPFGFQCFCAPTFTGPTCQEMTSSCFPNPCHNSGVCIESNSSFICKCLPGFTGSKCELFSTCQPECINGQCVIGSNGIFSCLCNPGFIGSYCQTDFPECASSPCKNGGLCSEPFPNYYACSCPSGYTGVNCEVLINVCQSNPCLYGGTCINSSPNFYYCLCSLGFTGKNCEFKLNVCASNPCKNNAACVENGDHYTCECLPGYQGLNCDLDIDECISFPCHNGGTCSTPYLNMFECECMPGYTGIVCDSWIDICNPNPCFYNATCIQHLHNDFFCNCSDKYTGKLCENPINTCVYEKCSKNFTNLNFNVYAEPQSFNFSSFEKCLIKSWKSANPNIIGNIELVLEDTRRGLELPNHTIPNTYAKRALSVNYSAFLTQLADKNVKIPTIEDLSRNCTEIVIGQVILYDQFWEISVCGRLDANNLKALEYALKRAWSLKNLNNQLIVDIFKNLIRIENFESQDVTIVSYLVYSNSEIFEKGKVDSKKVPSKNEFESALKQHKLEICQSSFSLNLCGTIRQSQESDLLNKIKMSWLMAPGGLGNLSNIMIQKQGIHEFISDNIETKIVTNFRYTLTVNGILLDQYSFNFNYESIKNYFFENFFQEYRQCPAEYPLSEAFTVITPNRLCISNLKRIEEIVTNWFKNETQSHNSEIKVKIVINGIEEQIDNSSNLFYKIPIFILKDSLFVKPSESLQKKIRDLFRSISISSEDGLKFTVVDIDTKNLYRVTTLFQFYFNERVNRKNISVLIDLIKISFNRFNYEKNSQVSIKLQEDVVLKKNQKILKAVRMLALITDQNNNPYDSKRTETDKIIDHLALSVNSKNSLLTDFDEKLLLSNTIQLDGYNVIKYTDLYILFVQNDYNELVPSVLTKISNFLSVQFKGSSILIINNEIFFDNGQILLGIRYMVENNFPDCFDLKCLNSFEMAFMEKFRTVSCKTFYYPCSKYQNPTRDFYSLELIGNVNSDEPQFASWIHEALINSWKKEYPEFKQIHITNFNIKQDLRIGSLGTQTTRIFYTIALDSKVFPKYEFPSPTNDRIEEEFVKLGSDLRIYPEKNSIPKNALASLYTQAYPLNPNIRIEIENKIASYYNNSSSLILFWELYSGEFRQDLVRLYYTLYENHKMKYECELDTLYLKNVSDKLSNSLKEYPIKSRYLDLEYEKFTYNFRSLEEKIKKVWFNKNLNSKRSIEIKNIDVRIHSFTFWTSIFRKIIIRINYFLTINKVNVDNNHQYVEPKLDDLKKEIMNISFYFPSKLFTYFVYGDPNFVNQDRLTKSVNFAWQRENLKKRIFPIKNIESSQILPNILFYDYNKGYSNLSKIFYKVMFNNFADQNDLFNQVPSEELLKSNLQQNSFQLCSLPSCQPVQFFNFFSTKNYTKSEIDQLVKDIKDAWILQNPFERELDLERYLVNNFYRLVPYKNNNSEIIYGIFYPMGLRKNPQNLDISDINDPSDANYNATIRTVYPRGDYEQYIPTNTSALVVEPVRGLQWWMILIIILACILFLLLLLLCLFAFCNRKRQKEKTKLKNYEYFQKSNISNLDNIQLDPGVSIQTTHMGNIFPKEEVIETRHSFRNLTDNNLYEISNYDINKNISRRRSISASDNMYSFGHLNNFNSTPNATVSKKNVIINRYYEDIHHHHSSVRRSLSDLNEMVDVISIDVKYPYEFETRIN